MRSLAYFTLLMLRAERAWVLAGLGATVFATMSVVALLALSGWFITAAGLAGATGAGLVFDFFRPSAGIRFFAISRTAARYLERIVTHDTTLRFLTELRTKVFKSIAAVSSSGRKSRSSELLQRMTGDLDAIDTLYLRLLVPALTATVTMFMIGLGVYLVDINAAASLAAFTICITILLLVSSTINRGNARRLALGAEALRVRTIDLCYAQTDLIFSGGLKSQKSKIARATAYLADTGRRFATVEAFSAAAMSSIAVGFVLAIIVVAGLAFQAKAIDGPLMVMLVVGTFAMAEVVAPLRRGAIEFGRIVFSAKRIEPVCKPVVATDTRQFNGNGGLAIDVANITFSRGPHAKPVLDNFSLKVKAGEKVALAGRSGCGKSTLLSLVAGQLQADCGAITLSRQTSEQPLLGYLTQATELFACSIALNLRIAAPSASDRELWDALELVELAEKVRGLKNQLDFELGEMGTGFSGGERRRIALARMILRRPQIWLLDEPTAGLDEDLARRLLANLKRTFPDATWILSAHHTRELELVDRVVRMDGGAVGQRLI